MFKKVDVIIESYQNVNIFLDNDIAGEKTALELQNKYPNVKDYNDFLCSNSSHEK
jgi:5S rRNA maturation endonuclease (ribonuclease M5)